MKYNPKEWYNSSFFRENKATQSKYYSDVADILDETFNPKSVVDVGCGSGVILNSFYHKGKEIKGYEGFSIALKYIPKEIRNYITIQDFSEKFPKPEKKYGLVVCMEVAEHLHETLSTSLIHFLSNLGDIIAFTAAPPKQGGFKHINEKPMEFWLYIFKDYDFYLDKTITKRLRMELRSIDNVHSWIHKNMVVMRKYV